MSIEGKLQTVLDLHAAGVGSQIPVGLSGKRKGHGLSPLAKAADMIEKRGERILNYLMHSVTNAAAEEHQLRDPNFETRRHRRQITAQIQKGARPF